MEGDRRQGSGGVEAPVDDGLAGRAVWLVVLLVVLTLWAGHHFGWKGGLPPAFMTVAIAVAAVSKLVNKLVGSDVLKRAGQAVQNFMKLRLTPSALGVMTAVLLIAILCVSTVVVESDGSEDTGSIRVFSASSPRDERVASGAFGPEQRLARFTIPFPWGRRFSVEADGYVGEAVRVRPIRSRKVRLADLTYAPSVLFRPGVDGLSLLEDGAVFSLWQVDSAEARVLVASDTPRSQASFLLGARRQADDSVVEKWRTDLRRLGAHDEIADGMVLTWREPVSLTRLREIPPDARLIAEITLGDLVISYAEVDLETERLMDVPMTDVLYDR